MLCSTAMTEPAHSEASAENDPVSARIWDQERARSGTLLVATPILSEGRQPKLLASACDRFVGLHGPDGFGYAVDGDEQCPVQLRQPVHRPGAVDQVSKTPGIQRAFLNSSSHELKSGTSKRGIVIGVANERRRGKGARPAELCLRRPACLADQGPRNGIRVIRCADLLADVNPIKTACREVPERGTQREHRRHTRLHHPSLRLGKHRIELLVAPTASPDPHDDEPAVVEERCQQRTMTSTACAHHPQRATPSRTH